VGLEAMKLKNESEKSTQSPLVVSNYLFGIAT
jgi:hypothetical protein